MAHILIVDDEPGIRDMLAMIFESDHHLVTTAGSGPEALQALQETQTPIDCILLDIKMPGMDGMETLDKIKELGSDVPVIMVSGHGTIETAVEATKHGAFDFLEKPPERERLLLLVRNATEKSQLVNENHAMREQLNERLRMLGSSKAMQNIRALIARVAPTDASVLITGANGSGKELVARAIHRESSRANRPFIAVNCAAIPHDLIESELFGHEKGAFTGAISQRIGKFEQADKGTLFLDEVGDMSLEAQAKVLRVIQENKFERVGNSSEKQISVNVRILAATNKNLAKEIEEGRFREDLFHRLNVIPIHVPPLRDRREDIPVLINAFADECCKSFNRKPVRFEEKAKLFLMNLPYTGNIRELRNIVQRLVILVPNDVITLDEVLQLGVAASFSASHSTSESSTAEKLANSSADAFANDDSLARSVILTEHELQRMAATEGTLAASSIVGELASHVLDEAMNAGTFQEFKDRAEKAYIEQRLNEYNWNISRTAEALHIQRSHLYTKMKKYGLAKDADGQQLSDSGD